MSFKDRILSLLSKNSWLVIFVLLLVVLIIISIIISRSNNDSEVNIGQVPVVISQDIDQDNQTFLRIGLTQLDSCDAVLEYYKTNALKEVTSWGLSDSYSSFAEPEFADDVIEISSQESSVSTTSSSGDYTATNIQVEGVDEADFVKTDGDYIYILNDKSLKIIDVNIGQEFTIPKLISEIEIDFYAYDMLLSLKPESSEDSMIDTLIIIGDSYSRSHNMRLIQIDIDDRDSPEIIADLTIDGRYEGVRLADNVIRLISVSSPLGFDWELPKGSGLRADSVALEANKEIIRNSELSNWVPAYQDNLSLEDSSKIESFIDCSKMLAPKVFSGLNTLSITTFNASKKLEPGHWQTVGLAADSQTIYATADSMYVATAEYINEDESAEDVTESDGLTVLRDRDFKTIIHKFNIINESDQDSQSSFYPVYIASGEVDGELLSQFAMDEYDGNLRVAVTIEDFSENKQENHIKILQPHRGILKEIGTLPGLGIDERIKAVRFMEEQAYIVTFREIDPLYALDLSDPTNPKALGELKITGFSSYLHPVAENLLLGVGQEADENGVRQGLQISLFDTSDANNPQRADQLLLSDILEINDLDSEDTYFSGSSVIEYDHHAFTLHDDTVYIPYYSSYSVYNEFDSTSLDAWGWNYSNSSGILVIEIEATNKTLILDQILQAPKGDVTASEEFKNSSDNYFAPIRTIIIDDLIYGVTDNSELVIWQLDTKELIDVVKY